MTDVLEKARATIAAHDLAAPDAAVLLMVSGGSDSTVLAYLGAALREAGDVGPVAMLHVNHQLRGEDADADERFVAALAEALDIPLFICSIDIAAAVRSVLFIGKLKHDPTMRILTHEKSSLAPPGVSLAFSLGDEGGFRWVGEYDITADEMLSGIEPQRETKTQQAKDLICTLLAGGKRVFSEDIDKAALERGIPGRTVRDAKRELGDALKSKIVEGRKKVFWME